METTEIKLNPDSKKDIRAEIFNPDSHQWNRIKDRIWELLKINVDPLGVPLENNPHFTPDKLKNFFEDPETIAVLLKEAEKILGFSFAIPNDYESDKTAYIYTTKIDPQYQNEGLVGVIMNTMEAELRKRKYQYITRDARVSNGYANKIIKHYADRIVEQKPHGSSYGQQVFFKIKL